MNLNTTLNFLIGFASFLLSAFTIFALAGFLSFHAVDARASEDGKRCVLLHSLYCDEIFRQSPVECDSSLCLHSSAFSYETTAIERKITGFTQQPLISISVVLLGNWSRSPRKKPLCGDDELLPDLPHQVLVHKPTLAMAAGCWHKVVDKTMPGYQVSTWELSCS